MIPLIAKVRIGRLGQPGIPVWIPLILFWLLLLPVVLVLLPVFWIACLVGRVHPGQATRVMWKTLTGVRGLRIEAGDRRGSVLIHVF